MIIRPPENVPTRLVTKPCDQFPPDSQWATLSQFTVQPELDDAAWRCCSARLAAKASAAAGSWLCQSCHIATWAGVHAVRATSGPQISSGMSRFTGVLPVSGRVEVTRLSWLAC